MASGGLGPSWPAPGSRRRRSAVPYPDPGELVRRSAGDRRGDRTMDAAPLSDQPSRRLGTASRRFVRRWVTHRPSRASRVVTQAWPGSLAALVDGVLADPPQLEPTAFSRRQYDP